MADIIDASRLLWCHNLTRVNSRPERSIQDWLSVAGFSPTIVGDAIALDGIDDLSFLNALAFDINRLSTAASETLRNVTEIPRIPKSLGWPHVKLYYSAFFYAHVLLRIWGRSPSYMRTTDLLNLRRMLTAYGIVSPFSLKTGQFLVQVSGPSFRVQITSDDGGGGTHEMLWREFMGAFNDLKVAVGASSFRSTDKVEVIQSIDRAISLISHGGSNKSWLSQMRNDINYRHIAGLWYPYSGRRKTTDLEKYVNDGCHGSVDFSKFLKSTGDDLALFQGACMFVIAFARRVVSDFAKVSGSSSFLSYGQRQFEMAYP
jgi:hypothetical protein